MSSGVQEEKLIKLLDLVEENYEALEALIKLVAALKRSGLLDALLEVAERSDDVLSSLARYEAMSSIGNMMMLMYMISNFDNYKLLKAAETMPPCIEKAGEIAVSSEKGLSIRELLRIMTSPEMGAALRALVEIMRCARKAGSQQR